MTDTDLINAIQIQSVSLLHFCTYTAWQTVKLVKLLC